MKRSGVTQKAVPMALALVMLSSTGAVTANADQYFPQTATAQSVDFVTVSALAKPSGFKVDAFSENAIKLKWNKVERATGYRIYRYNPKSKKWAKLKTVYSGSSTTFKDKSLTSATKQKYRIKAFRKSRGKTYWSTSASVNAGTRPTKVKEFSAECDYSSINLSWGRVKGAQGYQVYTVSSSGKKTKVATIRDGKNTSYQFEGLSEGKKYKFAVRAFYKSSYDKKNYFGNYGEATFATKSDTAPAKVTGVSGKGNLSSITVKWDKQDCAGYQVQLYYDSQWNTVKTINSGSTTSYKVTGLTPAREHLFRVRAFSKSRSGKVLYGAYSKVKMIETSYGSKTWSELDKAYYRVGMHEGTKADFELICEDARNEIMRRVNGKTGVTYYSGSGEYLETFSYEFKNPVKLSVNKSYTDTSPWGSNAQLNNFYTLDMYRWASGKPIYEEDSWEALKKVRLDQQNVYTLGYDALVQTSGWTEYFDDGTFYEYNEFAFNIGFDSEGTRFSDDDWTVWFLTKF